MFFPCVSVHDAHQLHTVLHAGALPQPTHDALLSYDDP